MRILADENIPRLVVESLRDAGHDIAWVLTGAPGSPATLFSLGHSPMV